MKRIISIIISIIALFGVVNFTACTNSDDGKFKIVTTIYAEYDWVNEILGEKKDIFSVKYILENGMTMHSYQVNAGDINSIAKADLFIYVGGESDEGWVEKALKEKTNKNRQELVLLDYVKGVSFSPEGEEEEEIDEHIWMSILNAKICVNKIAEKIAEIDSENKDYYLENAENYISELDKLHNQYKNVVENADLDTVIVLDKFSIRYLTHDYNLKHVSAYEGCGTEVNITTNVINTLQTEIDRLGVKYVVITEGYNIKNINAETIVNETSSKPKILTLNTMQQITKSKLKSDDSYLNFMKENLVVLQKALSLNA